MTTMRVYVCRTTYAQLEERADALRLRMSKLFDYLIMEHYMIVTPENASMFVELNDLLPADMRRIRLGLQAYYVVRDASIACNLRMHAVVTAILRDTLPTLRTMPEAFPGLPYIREEEEEGKKNAVSDVDPEHSGKAVAIDEFTYDAVVRRIRESQKKDKENERIGPSDVSSYIKVVLDALPANDFIDTIRSDQMQAFLLRETIQRPRSPVRTIWIPYDAYAFLQDVKELTGVPMSSMLIYLINHELKVSDVRRELEATLLNRNIKGTWGDVLGDLVRRAKE